MIVLLEGAVSSAWEACASDVTSEEDLAPRVEEEEPTSLQVEGEADCHLVGEVHSLEEGGVSYQEVVNYQTGKWISPF